VDDLLLEQIDKNPIVKQYKDLFRQLSGLHLEIRRVDGSVINPLHIKIAAKQLANSPTCPLKSTCPHISPNCVKINQETVEQLLETREPQVFLCPAGLKKIIAPVVFNEKVIGILLTGENASFRFNGIQPANISQLLLQFTNYIIKNELNPLNLNLHNSLTRQQGMLNKVMKYIKENFHCNQLTLREVSDNNGISYHYLSRLFKKELKTTFAQFRNKLRMEAATNLLRDRRLSVSEISYKCGFEDPAYFCKVFRGTFGSSPVTFRNKKSAKKFIKQSFPQQ